MRWQPWRKDRTCAATALTNRFWCLAARTRAISRNWLRADIRPAIFEEDKAELLSKLAVSMGKTAKMHIALDTGMGRIGFHPDENSLKEIERIAKLPGIEIEGMFTHFARADEADKAFTHLQYERYQKFHEGLEAAGVHIPMCHCANQCQRFMELPRMGLDAARAGITVYGLYPSDEVERNMKIYPAMEIRSFITYVKEVEPGHCRSATAEPL